MPCCCDLVHPPAARAPFLQPQVDCRVRGAGSEEPGAGWHCVHLLDSPAQRLPPHSTQRHRPDTSAAVLLTLAAPRCSPFDACTLHSCCPMPTPRPALSLCRVAPVRLHVVCTRSCNAILQIAGARRPGHYSMQDQHGGGRLGQREGQCRGGAQASSSALSQQRMHTVRRYSWLPLQACRCTLLRQAAAAGLPA